MRDAGCGMRLNFVFLEASRVNTQYKLPITNTNSIHAAYIQIQYSLLLKVIMKYQNLDVWKMSFTLCKHTYQAVEHIKDYAFKDQIRRSSLSVPSNIAEGIERGSPRETAYFLNVAKGSTGELKTQILLAYEFKYISQCDRDALCEKCERISRMLYSLIAKHKNQSSTNL